MKSAPAPAAPGAPAKIEAVQASAEKTVVVQSSLYRVELSNRGGVVKSWKLNKYFDDQKPPRPLELVNADGSQQLGWPFSLVLADSQLESQANNALYEMSPSSSDEVNAPSEITLHWSDGHLDVTKKMNFEQNYEIIDRSGGGSGRQAASRRARLARRIRRQGGLQSGDSS